MSRIRPLTLLIAGLLVTGCATTPPPPGPVPAYGMPAIALPNIPDRMFQAVEFGAVGDGKTMNTKAIQLAIDACSKSGGGTVHFAGGKYLTAPFKMCSNLNINLDQDATILFSDDVKNYPMAGDRYEPCMVVENGHDISITGSGTIDGQGAVWWKMFRANPQMPHRPFMVRFDTCQRVLVRGVTLTNSPMFHLVPHGCQDVTIDGVTIHAPSNSKNTDGIDPSGFRIQISNCNIDTGDDCIAFKPTTKIDPNRAAVEDALVIGCTFKHGHGMSVGGQTDGGIHHLVVRDCTFDGTEAGIRLKAPRGRGGLADDLTYENLTMKNVQWAISITSYYPEKSAPKDLSEATNEPVTPGTPIWKHIVINNVNATDCENAGRIIGLPEMPITEIVLTDVHISAKKPLVIAEAPEVDFHNCTVQSSSGKPITLVNAHVVGIDPDTGKSSGN